MSIIICGKMAAGKTTLAKALENYGFKRAVTVTTRNPRPGEINEVDYHFVSDEEFHRALMNGEYAEHTSYDASYGHVCYASKKSSYIDPHTVIVLNPRGVRTIKNADIPGTVIYLNASIETMRKRLELRGDDPVEIERRIREDEPDFADILEYADIVIDVDGLSENEVLEAALDKIKVLSEQISKWGNSIGIRIPVVVTESLGLQAGDQISCELKDGGLFMRKQQSTVQMFEQFYGKPFAEITQTGLGSVEEIDWGEDVGGEVY